MRGSALRCLTRKCAAQPWSQLSTVCESLFLATRCGRGSISRNSRCTLKVRLRASWLTFARRDPPATSSSSRFTGATSSSIGPHPADVQLAHAIVDAGADLIVGHHPHVLRGVERYRQGWIVYSLGNFVCDMLWDEELRETAICECRLTAAGLEDVRLIPVRINDDCQPVPLVW